MSREYRQFCGLARAMETVGGRWTLLVVRDLLAGPKRFTELQKGLPGIPTNVLSARLKELEETGVVTRRLLARGVAYEVTPYGRDLEDVMAQLGMWGARMMTARRDDEFFSVHALALALRGAFRPDKADDLDHVFDLRINGNDLRISITGGTVSFPPERDMDADTVIEADPDGIHQLLTGALSVDDALATHLVRITGNIDDALRFFEMFRLPAPIEPKTSSV
jgi:DNA-binding HxlR family transcriptional regulator